MINMLLRQRMSAYVYAYGLVKTTLNGENFMNFFSGMRFSWMW